MAVAFSTDLSTFVPERAIYIVGENSDGSLMYMTNQLQDFQIAVDSEEDVKQDANGNTIFSISRAKSCTVSFSTPLLTLELVAAMNGTEKEVGSATNLISVPKFETVKLIEKENKVAPPSGQQNPIWKIYLDHPVKNDGTSETPIYKISAAILTKDGSTKKKLERGVISAGTHGVFSFTKGSGDTLPDSQDRINIASDDVEEGDNILITYEYETAAAIQIVNSALDFPSAARTKVMVRGYDVCDKNTAIYAYFIFPSAKFQTNYTLGMALDQNIDCNLTCSYDYCSDQRELYRMVVAGE